MPSRAGATRPTPRSTRSSRPAWSFRGAAGDVAAATAIARDAGLPVIARGGGTSQNGQPVGSGLVLDFSRHMNAVRDYDPDALSATVEPGLVLERLNAKLRADGLFFPVEPSTSSRCTIGGMTANNSLRRPVDPVRQDGRQRPRHRGAYGRRRGDPRRAAGRQRPGHHRLARGRGPRRPDGGSSPRASGPRSNGCTPRCSAASAATTSTRCCPRTRTSPTF